MAPNLHVAMVFANRHEEDDGPQIVQIQHRDPVSVVFVIVVGKPAAMREMLID